MAESKQDLLRSAWLEGKDGALSGREQAKAWALREIWKGAGKADHGTGIAMHIVFRTRTRARHEEGSEHSAQANMSASSHSSGPVKGPTTEHNNEHEHMCPELRTLFLASPATA